jgi:hypothetical protein
MSTSDHAMARVTIAELRQRPARWASTTWQPYAVKHFLVSVCCLVFVCVCRLVSDWIVRSRTGWSRSYPCRQSMSGTAGIIDPVVRLRLCDHTIRHETRRWRERKRRASEHAAARVTIASCEISDGREYNLVRRRPSVRSLAVICLVPQHIQVTKIANASVSKISARYQNQNYFRSVTPTMFVLLTTLFDL